MARPQKKDDDPGSADASKSRIFASKSGAEDVLGEKPLNGYFTTLVHLVKGYVGTGIFAMGEGYKHSGLLMGTVALVIISVMNLNCQHILIKAAGRIASQEEDEDVKPSFAETVEYTLETSRLSCVRNHSKALAMTTNVFLCVAELGFCCVYFVFIADHLEMIAANHNMLVKDQKGNKNIILAIILLPMWASTFLSNLKLLLPLSIISNVLIWIGVGIILYYATYEGLPSASERNLISDYKLMPLYFGTVLFAFEGITFVIPLKNEMKNSKQFGSAVGVLNSGMIIVTVLYFLVGFLSYWKWGDDVKSSVFLNIAKEEDLTISDVVDSLMVVAILFTFTLHMYIPFEITFPLFYRKYGPFEHGKIVAAVYRSVPVLFTFFLANVIPFLGLFISLIGATAGAFLALIMPPLLEIVAGEKLSFLVIVKDVAIIVVGVVGAILGTVLSVIDIVKAFDRYYIK